MRYRRDRTPGATYVFTVVAADRRPIFRHPNMVECLREAFRVELRRRPFEVYAMVVLPDHLHAIWNLPEDDADYSIRWRQIKGWVTRHCPRDLLPEPSPARVRRGEQELWQRRFWEHRFATSMILPCTSITSTAIQSSTAWCAVRGTGLTQVSGVLCVPVSMAMTGRAARLRIRSSRNDVLTLGFAALNPTYDLRSKPLRTERFMNGISCSRNGGDSRRPL